MTAMQALMVLGVADLFVRVCGFFYAGWHRRFGEEERKTAGLLIIGGLPGLTLVGIGLLVFGLFAGVMNLVAPKREE